MPFAKEVGLSPAETVTSECVRWVGTLGVTSACEVPARTVPTLEQVAEHSQRKNHTQRRPRVSPRTTLDDIDVILCVVVCTNMSKSAIGYDGVGVREETHSIEHVTVIQQPNGYVQFSDIQKRFGCP